MRIISHIFYVRSPVDLIQFLFRVFATFLLLFPWKNRVYSYFIKEIQWWDRSPSTELIVPNSSNLSKTLNSVHFAPQLVPTRMQIIWNKSRISLRHRFVAWISPAENNRIRNFFKMEGEMRGKQLQRFSKTIIIIVVALLLITDLAIVKTSRYRAKLSQWVKT